MTTLAKLSSTNFSFLTLLYVKIVNLKLLGHLNFSNYKTHFMSRIMLVLSRGKNNTVSDFKTHVCTNNSQMI